MKKCFICERPAREDLFEEVKTNAILCGKPPKTIVQRAYFCSNDCRKKIQFLAHFVFSTLCGKSPEELADELYFNCGIDYADTYYMLEQLRDSRNLKKLEPLFFKIFDFFFRDSFGESLEESNDSTNS